MKNCSKDSKSNDQLVLHGKPATDSGLYPWALGALGKSILFYAEASELEDNKPVKIISGYYTIFHLSIFLMFAAPKLLSPKERKAINYKLRGGSEDPSPAIKHMYVEDFLKRCSEVGLPLKILELFKEMKKSREFVNYGPRVRWVKDDIFINTCEVDLNEIDDLIGKLKDSFISSIDWICSRGSDNGVWIPIILEQTAKFFNKTIGFYKGWIPENVRQEAESLRGQLYEIALKKVYEKGRQK